MALDCDAWLKSLMVAVSSNVSAIILAGGQSSRLGQDKALVAIGDRPLLATICEVALAVAAPVKVVTPWPKRYQAIVPPTVKFVQENHHPRQGPVVGLLCGMQKVQTEWILALACDLPRLSATSLDRWRSQLGTLPAEVVAYLPRQGDRWEPLCGFYRASCIDSLTAFVTAGGRSFQRWLAAERVQAISETDPQELFNLNTPTDLAQL